MPRRFTGKLFQFLFRHLELGTFGERLRWLDRESGIFQLLWKHGNGSSVTPTEDFALFLNTCSSTSTWIRRFQNPRSGASASCHLPQTPLTRVQGRALQLPQF
uniref:52 kD repressor of inhibitor of protein kinase n=1 Tax=Rhipicephalus appendiculatus TaxID=34631 RepID=A0A131YHV3_RHIAP